MGKYVFGQEETKQDSNDGFDMGMLKESLNEEGLIMENGKSRKPKYSMKEAKMGKKPMQVKKVVEKKQMKEFTESTPEYDQAVRFLIKDLVKNHGVSRGASLERILSMFQVFYSKAIEYGDSAGAKKVKRTLGKYL